MKPKEEMQLAWKRLSEHPDFRDCARDLMRFAGFWRGLSSPSPEQALCRCASQSVITYIFDQVEWAEIPGDFTAEEKRQRMKSMQERNRS